jgi:ABC-2 type transport system ATP-binding protein
MIEVKNVYKYFDDRCINDDITLTIPQGTVFGLLGPNGAGKTTLIRMLATVTTPDRGEIMFNQQPLSSKHIPLIGYMPEERGLYRKMSVVDQLLYFAELKGLKRSEAKERVKHWMKKMDILDWADKKMEELSKGMAQKVQFISTILHKPQFLILDEPFSGFDPVNADLIKELILEMKNEGTTFLFSTHRMDNVEELCDNLAIIHQGSKILDGKIHDIRRSFFQNEYDLCFSENPGIEATHNSDSIIKNFENNNNDLNNSTHNSNSIPKNEENSPSESKFTSASGNLLFGKYAIQSLHCDFDNRFWLRIQTHENQTLQTLLNDAFQTGKLVGFQEYVPSIHQIFVNQVTEKES